jgi:hypothetical protein
LLARPIGRRRLIKTSTDWTYLIKRTIEYLIALLVISVGLSGPLLAQQASESKSDQIDTDAMKALNDMGKYLRTLKDFQVEAAVTDEDVLENGEKVQYGHTTNILASSPNKMRVDINGELNSQLFLYDGEAFTLFARRAGFYATVKAPPTVVELADVLDKKYDIQIPLVDLFLWGGPHAPPTRSLLQPTSEPVRSGVFHANIMRSANPVWIGKSGFS